MPEQTKDSEAKPQDEKKQENQSDNKENQEDKGRPNKRDGSYSSRSSRYSDKSGDDGRKKQKEYFKEELKRLKTSLDREASKIEAPSKQKHVPYVHNTLEPYYDVSTPRYLIELPDQIRHGYVSRQTAIGLCDPWVDHDMDVTLLPTIESKQYSPDEDKKKKGDGSQREKEGSTRLPKFPAVSVPTDDITKNKKIYWSDVPMIREELKKKIGSNAEQRVNSEYDRTKKDFYRMELDKMDEYHPSSRPKMRATYFAYLQNNAGSKKAVYECVRETEKKQEDGNNKQQGSNNNNRNNRQQQKSNSGSSSSRQNNSKSNSDNNSQAQTSTA